MRAGRAQACPSRWAGCALAVERSRRAPSTSPRSERGPIWDRSAGAAARVDVFLSPLGRERVSHVATSQSEQSHARDVTGPSLSSVAPSLRSPKPRWSVQLVTRTPRCFLVAMQGNNPKTITAFLPHTIGSFNFPVQSTAPVKIKILPTLFPLPCCFSLFVTSTPLALIIQLRLFQ